jgi:hypothetical protein
MTKKNLSNNLLVSSKLDYLKLCVIKFHLQSHRKSPMVEMLMISVKSQTLVRLAKLPWGSHIESSPVL